MMNFRPLFAKMAVCVGVYPSFLSTFSLGPGISQHDSQNVDSIFDVVNGENLISRSVKQGNSAELIKIHNMIPSSLKKHFFVVAFRTAIQVDDSAIVRLLFQMPEGKSTVLSGMPLLSYAALTGSQRTVSYLAEVSDNFARDQLGRCPIHYAVSGGPVVIKKLAKSDILINMRDSSGMTPLHFAARSKIESVRTLLDLGADPNVRDSYGKRPIDYVRMHGNSNVIWRMLARRTTSIHVPVIRTGLHPREGLAWAW